MNPKSKEYKALQATWDAKLKKSGFVDIEQRDGNLKRWDGDKIPRRLSNLKFQVQAEFYRSAGMFLHEHTFVTSSEKNVWALFAEGLTVRDISKKLKKSKWNIHTTIQRLTKVMVAKWRE